MGQPIDGLSILALRMKLAHHDGFPHVRINDQNRFPCLGDRLSQVEDDRALALIWNTAGKQDRPHIISAELDVGTEGTEGFLHGITVFMIDRDRNSFHLLGPPA